MRVTSNADTVIIHLQRYRDNVPQKLQTLLDKLSYLGAYRARVDFSSAMYAGTNDVEITVEPKDNGFEILASGYSVLFIEFGTGIKNPEHPLSAEFGYIHGTYGQGKGANEHGWVYYGEQGNAGQPVREGVYRTLGNPPARAMYNAGKEIRERIEEIAKEVFGND